MMMMMAGQVMKRDNKMGEGDRGGGAGKGRGLSETGPVGKEAERRRHGIRGRAGKGSKSAGIAGSSTGVPAWLTRNTGQSIKTIASNALEEIASKVTSEDGFQLLCSYSWAARKAASIYVPGTPPSWKPMDLPTALAKDSGAHFVDQNAFLAPTYPFEPLFRSLGVMNPTFTFSSIDLVTNRNSLRKLLKFAAGRATESFRIDLNMVQNTLFFTRRVRNTREFLDGSRNTGYGRNFERAFTQPEPGLEESSGHHRVLRYKIGDTNCVVQFEVDACCEGDDKSKDPAGQQAGETPQPDPDEVLASLSRLSLASSKPKGKTVGRKIRTIRSGRLVPSSTMAEIKTGGKMTRMNEALPQLWFGRIPCLFRATHKDGTFTEVNRVHAADQFPGWEDSNQESLRKMAYLITELRETALQAKNGACVAVCNHRVKPPTLEMFESTTEKQVLPDELLRQYWVMATPGE